MIDRLAQTVQSQVPAGGAQPFDDASSILFWLHATSDLTIAMSYFVISATLLLLYLRIRHLLPFQWVVPAFGLFIVACGGTHVMHVLLSLDLPVDRLAALVQGLTVGASVAVAIALPPLAPRVIVLFETARVSRQRQKQLEASRSEKLRALGQLASGVAHDLNQSLGIIAGYSDLARQLLDEPDLDTRALRENLHLIAQAAQDGGETVKRLLTYGRAQPDGDPDVVDVTGLLQDVVKLTAPRWRDLAHRDGCQIDMCITVERDPMVRCWPGMLREAITNLVFNAVDALPRGGVITLAAREADGEVQISVTDDGPGIAPDLQARIFEPFFTTKGERGTGLGLSMVFGIVERHGGTVTVESEPGHGTAFTISLPVRPAPATPAPIDDVPAVTQLRVLSVDDEPALATLVASFLRKDGHLVVTATTGELALQRLREGMFDLVVSDLGLGDGISGWDLAEQVRAEHPATRFILATGWGSGIDGEEARTRGVDAVLPKPYRADGLRKLVADVMAADRATLRAAESAAPAEYAC